MARRAKAATGRTSGRRKLGTGAGTMQWDFDVDPSPLEIKEILGKDLAKDLSNAWRPALEGAGFIMSGHVLNTYDKQGAPIGKRWPTAMTHARKRYLKEKQEAGYGKTPMVRTGKMRKNLEKRKPVSLTNKRVVVGLRGKRWPMVQYLQFHKKYFFVDWNVDTAADVQEVFNHHANAIMARVARRFNNA